ncbi:MAG: hypothetical protein FWE74_04590 [Oscillospiraceae bacterium]|nr:hypothetical protein [Oscillospiraceae bacterium]
MYYFMFFLLTFFSIYGAVCFLKSAYRSLLVIMSRKEENVRIWLSKTSKSPWLI